MNGFRHWLADLISGGELAFQTKGWSRVNALYQHSEGRLRNEKDVSRKLRSELEILKYDNRNGWANSAMFSDRLSAIAAMETPGANATVRRMARMARGEV